MRLRRPNLTAATAAVVGVGAFAFFPALANAQESGVPGDASAQCKDFINVFNRNSDFSQCTDPLLSAVTQYTKATSQKGATPTSDANALSTALDALCKPGAGCSAATMKGIVRNFASDCLQDLVAPKTDVVSLYDKLYLITPFQNALCSKDDHDKYCVTTLAESGQVGNETKRSLSPEGETEHERFSRGINELAGIHDQLLARAASGNSDGLETFDVSDHDDGSAEIIWADSGSQGSESASSNLPFLFLQPDSPKSILCATCAQKIMASYIQFETTIPYAIGLANSDILKSQSPLYKAGQSTCGKGWASKVNQLAGTSAFAEVSPASTMAGRTRGVWVGASVTMTALLFATLL